jgi:hypothetical protein
LARRHNSFFTGRPLRVIVSGRIANVDLCVELENRESAK